MKVCPVEAELFHVNRWMHRHGEAISHFSQFCKHT